MPCVGSRRVIFPLLPRTCCVPMRIPERQGLPASGYLDMQGNVWGAIVQGGDAWCDVVLVNTEGGRESTVRVTRLLPGEV